MAQHDVLEVNRQLLLSIARGGSVSDFACRVNHSAVVARLQIWLSDAKCAVKDYVEGRIGAARVLLLSVEREKRIWPCRERIGQTDVVRDIGRPPFGPALDLGGLTPLGSQNRRTLCCGCRLEVCSGWG